MLHRVVVVYAWKVANDTENQMRDINLTSTGRFMIVADLSPEERSAVGFLNGLETDHIEKTGTAITEAVMEGGERRDGVIRHLRQSFHFSEEQAETILDRWIWEEQE